MSGLQFLFRLVAQAQVFRTRIKATSTNCATDAIQRFPSGSLRRTRHPQPDDNFGVAFRTIGTKNTLTHSGLISQSLTPKSLLASTPLSVMAVTPTGITCASHFPLYPLLSNSETYAASGLQMSPRLVLPFINTESGCAKCRWRTQPFSSTAACALSQSQSTKPSPASGFTVK